MVLVYFPPISFIFPSLSPQELRRALVGTTGKGNVWFPLVFPWFSKILPVSRLVWWQPLIFEGYQACPIPLEYFLPCVKPPMLNSTCPSPGCFLSLSIFPLSFRIRLRPSGIGQAKEDDKNARECDGNTSERQVKYRERKISMEKGHDMGTFPLF